MCIRDRDNPLTDPQTKQDDKNADPFPHTFLLPNQTRACEEGYSSGRVIDERGCWMCFGCQTNEICKFPDICEKASPTIKKASVSKGQVIIEYFVDSNHFNPDIAYCKLGENKTTAVKVTSSIVICNTPKKRVPTLQISFDDENYSPAFLYPRQIIDFDALNEKFNGIPIDRFLLIVAIFGILLYVGIQCWNRPRRYHKLPVYMEVKPIAHFPQVDNEDPEVPYSKMNVKF